MSSSNAAAKPKTFKSKFNEETTLGVLSKLKGAHVCLDTLHGKINDALAAIENRIIAAPDNAMLKEMLLEQMEIHGKTKCVATIKYEKCDDDGNKLFTKTGKPVTASENINKKITANGDWIVSVVRGGTGVRIHLSDAAREALLATLTSPTTTVTMY